MVRALRVWLTAKRLLGRQARLIQRPPVGPYLVAFDGHRLRYHQDPIDGRSFRLLYPCTVCGRPTEVHTYDIRHPDQIQAAVELAKRLQKRCTNC